ncbi:MAG: hypothetical protein ACOYLH_12840, partial [Flavobacteriales bacterium]
GDFDRILCTKNTFDYFAKTANFHLAKSDLSKTDGCYKPKILLTLCGEESLIDKLSKQARVNITYNYSDG